MEEFLNEQMLSICSSLSEFFVKYYGNFVSVGKAIGGVLCLVVVASEAFQMMQLKKGIDVLALLRPILISFVLMNWSTFTFALREPFGAGLEEYAREGIYRTQQEKVKLKHEERMKVQLHQYEILQAARAEAEVADKAMEQAQDEGTFDSIFEQVEDYFLKFVDWRRTIDSLLTTTISSWVERLIQFIATIIWNCAVLITFFGKEVALGVLTITGPITFGLSVLPIWKDSWASWVTRYISFCLYGFVAYLVMAAALQLFLFGIEVDIKRLSDPNLIVGDLLHFSFVYSLLASIVGWHGLRMVPEMVSWIVPTNTSQAISRFVGGVNNTVTSGAKTAGKAAAAAVAA